MVGLDSGTPSPKPSRCIQVSASASRSNTCGYFRSSSSIWRFLYFFLQLHQRWAHLLLPLVEYDSRCFHLKHFLFFFFFLVQPQHHCALNPVIFICLDSDTTADAKYIAQVDTLTILPLFLCGKRKTLFNLLFKQLFPFSCFCNTLSYYLFLRVPRMFRYLGHKPPLRSCLLASWVFCVQLCAFALLLARIVLRVADGPRRRWRLGVTPKHLLWCCACTVRARMCVTETPDNLLLSVCWHGASSTVLELLLSPPAAQWTGSAEMLSATLCGFI